MILRDIAIMRVGVLLGLVAGSVLNIASAVQGQMPDRMPELASPAKIAGWSGPEQLAWLNALWKERIEPAALLAFPPGEFEQVEKAFAEITADVQQGRQLDRETAATLLTYPERYEQAALEQQVRQYRDALRTRYGQDPDGFERQRQQWATLYRAWEAAGQPADGRRVLIAWLQSSVKKLAKPGPADQSPVNVQVLKPVETQPIVSSQGDLMVGEAMPGTRDMIERRPSVEVARPRPATPPSLDRLPEPVQVPGRNRTAQINIGELSAMAAGYTLAMKDLGQDLESEQTWNARRLAGVMIRLESLLSRREDLLLYYPLVDATTRATLDPLLFPDRMVNDLKTKILAAYQRTRSPDEFASPEEQQVEVDLLDELSRRVKEFGDR